MSIFSPSSASGKSTVAFIAALVLYPCLVGLTWLSPQVSQALYASPGVFTSVGFALPTIVMIYCVLLVVLYSQYAKPFLKNFALSAPSITQLLMWVAVAVVYILLVKYEFYANDVRQLWHLFPMFHYHFASPGHLSWLTLLLYLLAVPFVLECLFRGIIFTGLSSTFGEFSALIVTTYVWAMSVASHSPMLVVVNLVMGLLYGLARINTKSVWTPFVMDFVIRLLLLYMAGVFGNVIK